MTLPVPLTRFVGRDAELLEAAALLGATRLLTLTGPGGAGKTRLAIQLAADLEDRFPDGVWFVDLSALSGGEFVWDEVMSRLGVVATGSGGEAAGRYLAPRRGLLLLDNCEHVVAAAAEVAAELLAEAPQLKVMATSREPLGVGGEVTWAVPPLTDADGIDLFSDRARQARPHFSLRETDAEAVRSICRRLDGMPLAIELAAARARAFSPADIASALQGRLELLPAGPRTAPARHATLQASFDWSHDLLSEPERALLRQGSVFAGGFDLEAATAVCPAADLDVLGALVDRSLLLVEEDPATGISRYRMLEPIRQFAAGRLAEAGEAEAIRSRHRDHYLQLAETAEPLLAGPEEDLWRSRLTREMDNLRAALAWSRDHGDAESLARMVSALMWFWTWPGRIREFLAWLDAAVVRSGDLAPGVRARLLNLQCLIPVVVPGSAPISEVPARVLEALALAREAGDKREEAFAILIQGFLAGLLGGADAMRPFMEEGLPLARSVRSSGFGVLEATARSVFALMHLLRSAPEETWRMSEEAIEVAQQFGDRHTRLFCMSFGGFIALTQGRLEDAHRLHEAVVTGGRDTIDSNYLHSLLGLGWGAMLRGDLEGAHMHIAESLEVVKKAGADSRSITSLEPHARMLNGWLDLAEGNAAGATEKLAVVVSVARPSIISWIAAVPLVVLAQAQLALGEADEAAAFLEEANAMAQPGKLTWVRGRVAGVRAELATREGDVQKAESAAHEALTLGREAGDQMGVVDALELLARIAAEQESHREAVRLCAAADSMRDRLGYRLVIDRAAHEAAIAKARENLADFSAVWAEGAKLSVEDAIAYAARGRGERKRPTTGWASLTPSELEVARLVGEHLSNPEIATRLFVSRATVKTHLVHIFAKLGIESRSELAAQAISRRQTSPS
jgi:predicted ATPase/DNA-binding CsgD family transcriptional regulator